MGIIRDGTAEIMGKKVRIKVFGYKKDGVFIGRDTYINQTDLVNIGIFKDDVNHAEVGK